METNKKLSLIHLEIGMDLLNKLAEDPTVLSRLVAVALATPSTLSQFKRKGEDVLTPLIEQAEAMDSEEAGAVIANFTETAKRFATVSQKGTTTLPQDKTVTEKLAEISALHES